MDLERIENLLGERIINAREAKGYSQKQLADRLGVKKSTVAHWESERSAPRANRLNQLAGVLDVPLLWLLAGAEAPEAIDAPNLSETSGIEVRLQRADELVNELSAIIAELRGDTRRVQRELDKDSVVEIADLESTILSPLVGS